jgi:membrane-bound lytic murein transglycosylase D
VTYRVRAGDTLEFIADRYDVTPYQIRRWNNLKTSRLTPGKPLRIYVAGGSRSASGKAHSKGRKNPVSAGKKPSPTKTASGTGTAAAAPKATPSQLAESH